MGFFSSLFSVFTDVFKTVLKVFNEVAKILNQVAAAFGITQPDDDLEDLGARALQAEANGDIFREDFDNQTDYINALRDYDKFDPTDVRFSKEACQVEGIGLAVTGLEQKLGLNEGAGMSVVQLITDAPKTYATVERITDMLEKGIDVQDVNDYVHGDLAFDKVADLEKSLIAFEKALDPEKSDTEIERGLEAVKAETEANIEARAAEE